MTAYKNKKMDYVLIGLCFIRFVVKKILFRDEVFLEVINDRNGLHVRPGTLRFLIQAAGLDRICGVTDACTGVKDDTDVNLEPEGLCGSKLTMNVAARNFRDNAGLSCAKSFAYARSIPPALCAWTIKSAAWNPESSPISC